MSFNSKYTGAQVEEMLDKIPTSGNIWTSENDGRGSGLNADLLDGKHDGYIIAESLRSRTNDNSSIVLYSATRTDNTWPRSIVDNGYGLMIASNNTTGYIATLNSNVASATKLQTSRTIWGRSFDGSGNVDGNMIVKGQYVCITLQGTNSYNTGIVFNDYEGNPRWDLSYRGLNAADKDFYIYRYTDDNSYHVAMSFIRSNGNVGIGTTNPTTKLDVTGSIHSSGGITQDSDINLKNKIKDVLLSINEIAEAPLFEFTYKSDKYKRIHVGTSAQYWIEKNNWFCKKQNNGYYDMEIQNLALASAISIAKEFKKYKEKTESTISSMKKEIEELKHIVLNMNK